MKISRFSKKCMANKKPIGNGVTMGSRKDRSNILLLLQMAWWVKG